MVPQPMFLLLRIHLVFLFHMYRFGLGLSISSRKFFSRANYERLGRRKKGSEIFVKWLLHFGFMSTKRDTNFRTSDG